MKQCSVSQALVPWLALLLAFTVGPPALAGEPERPTAHSQGPLHKGPGLSFNEAWELVKNGNSEFRASELDSQAALSRGLQASKYPNPRLAVGVEEIGAFGSLLGHSKVALAIEQSLPLGGRLAAAEQLEQGNMQLIQERMVSLEAVARQTLRSQFVNILGTQLRAHAMERTRQRFSALLEMVQAQVATGSAPAVRALRLEQVVRLKAQMGDSIYTEANQQIMELPALWGAPAGSIQALAATLPEPPVEPYVLGELASPNQWPQVRACRASANIWSVEARLREAQGIPDLSVAMGYTGIEAFDTHAIMVEFSIPIPILDDNSHAVDEARALERASTHRCVGIEVQLQAALTARIKGAKELLRQQRELSADLLPSALAALIDAMDAYAQGEASLDDVIGLIEHTGDLETMIAHHRTNYWLVMVEIEGILNTNLFKL